MLTTIQQKKVMIKKHPVLIRYFFKKNWNKTKKTNPFCRLKSKGNGVMNYYLDIKIKADNLHQLINRLDYIATSIESNDSAINISNKIAKIKLIKKEVKND